MEDGRRRREREKKTYRASSIFFFPLSTFFSKVKTKEKPGGNEAKIRQEKKKQKGAETEEEGFG